MTSLFSSISVVQYEIGLNDENDPNWISKGRVEHNAIDPYYPTQGLAAELLEGQTPKNPYLNTLHVYDATWTETRKGVRQKFYEVRAGGNFLPLFIHCMCSKHGLWDLTIAIYCRLGRESIRSCETANWQEELESSLKFKLQGTLESPQKSLLSSMGHF